MSAVVELERLVSHPVERVFAVWLDGPRFAEWFLPDPDVRLGRVEVDARVGGTFLIEMLVAGQRLAHTGAYTIIDPPRRIVFTWRSAMTGESDSVVDVRFEARGEKTLLRLQHTGLLSGESRSAHANGWSHIVGCIDPLLQKE